MIDVRSATLDDAPAITAFQIRMAEETEGLSLDVETVPEWSGWCNATVLWIHSLYSLPGAREKGVWRHF